MRIIIQRVWSGSVTKVETGEVTGKIDRGLLLYFGINRNDKEKDIDAAVKKVLGMKLWDSADGKKRWCRSVVDMKFEVLVVSQFTLYAVLNGTKPDFHESMQADQSHPFFDKVVQRFKDLYSADKIQTGAFGNYMKIDTSVDGPVNIIIDIPKNIEQKPQTTETKTQNKKQKQEKKED